MPHLAPQVLVFDPNFVTRIALTTRLLEIGCEVRSESQLPLALHSAGTLGWALIVLPLNVPDLVVASFLKDLEPSVPRAIVAVVCDAEHSARQQLAHESGAGVLLHPIRPSSLRAHLRIPEEHESRIWLPIDAAPAPKPDCGDTPGADSGRF